MRYLTEGLPGIGGQVRWSPEDFEVEEISLYEPAGMGSHTYFVVEKRGLSTFRAVGMIARTLGVPARQIGYAGMKDAHALTRQTLSVEGVPPERVLALDLPGHGDSKGESVSSISDYSQWLLNVLESHFETPPYLMGHSMGGAVVQEVALEGPEQVKGMILAATGPRLGVAPAFLEGLEKNFDKIIDTIMRHAYAPGVDSRMLRDGAALMRDAGGAVVYGDFLACDQFDM